MKNLIGLCMVAALLAAGAAQGQETASPTSATPLPESIVLPLDKGELFTLPSDARDVLVANTDIADVIIKTPRLAYVFAQGVGDTNVFFLDADGGQILRLEIHVEPDLTALRAALAKIMPGEDIDVMSTNQHIILSGSVASAQAAEDARLLARRFVTGDEEIVNMLRIASDQQVLLNVKVAEMQRTAVKELGFNASIAFSKAGQHDTTAFSLFTGNGPSPTAFGSGGTISLLSTTFDALSILFDALESQGVVKTLAEPNLTAVSGENANFLAGGEFPVPNGVDQNGNLLVEFRKFGIVLTFTPVVLSSGLINLKISTEVSQLSDAGAIILSGTQVPSLVVNRAETTVELPSGGGLVIAGLLQNDIENSVDGFPGLKNIPILGTLFRSTAFKKNETELIIAVTAFLIRPVGNRSIALPTDGFAPASDFDMYFLGRLHSVYAKPENGDREALPGGLLGPIGYIME